MNVCVVCSIACGTSTLFPIMPALFSLPAVSYQFIDQFVSWWLEAIGLLVEAPRIYIMYVGFRRGVRKALSIQFTPVSLARLLYLCIYICST